MECANKEKHNIINENQMKFIMKLLVDSEVDVKTIANDLGVSRQTIYNYYFMLRSFNLERHKGKISIKGERSNQWSQRFVFNKELKLRIAQHIITSKYIEDYDRIFLDCGSTNVYIADQIREEQIHGLTVITSNPYCINRLISYEHLAELLVIGGSINANSGAFGGPWAETLIDNIDPQEFSKKTFIGVDGLSVEDGVISLVTSNLTEVEQKKKIIGISLKVYFILDDSKLDGRGGNILSERQDEFRAKNYKLIIGHGNEKKKDLVKHIQKILGDSVDILI